ncbi:MAG: ATP-binding protein [Planktomarina sp.]
MAKLILKRFLPNTLYGRAAVILLLPMLTLQLAVTVIFVQRHFEDVTVQMTQNVTSEIRFVLDELETRSITAVALDDALRLGLSLTIATANVSDDGRVWYDISGRTVIATLYDDLPSVLNVDLSNLRHVALQMGSAKGPVAIQFARQRVSASNPHQLIVLMMLTGLFMTVLAYFFLRKQLRPIKQLADAASAFGRGQVVPLNLRGAVEVRAASQSFLDMRDRIERQIEQRTMMLSGVSHDLRTPLTRMQLALEMVDGAEDWGLKQDVTDMTAMLDGYLTYARDAASEAYDDVDVLARMTDMCDRSGPNVTLDHSGTPRIIPLRPTLALRAASNLVSNGLKYGAHVRVHIAFRPKVLTITVEDDGPGIPTGKRDAALRPFVRLEGGRNQNKSGVGLGLAITNDAVRSHGGTFTLGNSDMGGLKATIMLPVARAV